jgi:hypothetical protein
MITQEKTSLSQEQIDGIELSNQRHSKINLLLKQHFCSPEKQITKIRPKMKNKNSTIRNG